MKLNVKFREGAIFNVNLLQEDQAIQTGFGAVQTVTSTNYNDLANKPSINGVTLQGDLTSEDLHIEASASFPTEGNIGDILMKTAMTVDGVSWITPASRAEEDNTRPITAAAVYTEIGNINALLATI